MKLSNILLCCLLSSLLMMMMMGSGFGFAPLPQQKVSARRQRQGQRQGQQQVLDRSFDGASFSPPVDFSSWSSSSSSSVVLSSSNSLHFLEHRPTKEDRRSSLLSVSSSLTSLSLTLSLTLTLLFSSSLGPKMASATVSAVTLLPPESDDVEIVDLPSPYIPLLLGAVLFGGVALLNSSLGDVFTEEARLANLGSSGAMAKKERDRNQSSYFKRDD